MIGRFIKLIIQYRNHKRCLSYDSNERIGALWQLEDNFSSLPIKQQAWNDIHKLTNDKFSDVRSNAAKVLGSVISYVSDKQQAWDDLHRLTNDENSWVRSRAASALGSAFSHVPDKQQAWNDLIELTNDRDFLVRISANYSLGKASIFKASQAETEEDYKRELENAIKFFENVSQRSPSWNDPAQFCLPFYRSFHTIIFKKPEAKDEVDKYLEKAKAAIEDSESKKQLFEAVENLANALTEVQNLENMDLEAMKSELNSYRKYCDRVEEIMKNTEQKAPYAVGAMRIGSRILDKDLKSIIKEIQRKAKKTCQQSQGTPIQEIACAVNQEVQNWRVSNQEEMTQKVENMIFYLMSKIPDIPENRIIHNKIEYLRNEKDLVKQYETLLIIISLIPQIAEPKKPFIKKFTNSFIASLGVASTSAGLSELVCGIYNVENHYYASTIVFTVS